MRSFRVVLFLNIDGGILGWVCPSVTLLLPSLGVCLTSSKHCATLYPAVRTFRSHVACLAMNLALDSTVRKSCQKRKCAVVSIRRAPARTRLCGESMQTRGKKNGRASVKIRSLETTFNYEDAGGKKPGDSYLSDCGAECASRDWGRTAREEFSLCWRSLHRHVGMGGWPQDSLFLLNWRVCSLCLFFLSIFVFSVFPLIFVVICLVETSFLYTRVCCTASSSPR